jgi:hypothetical protein
MLPDTDIDDVKKQRNAEYAKHINDPVLSSLKMEGIRFYHQELLNCNYSFWFYLRLSLPAAAKTAAGNDKRE